MNIELYSYRTESFFDILFIFDRHSLVDKYNIKIIPVRKKYLIIPK